MGNKKLSIHGKCVNVALVSVGQSDALLGIACVFIRCNFRFE